MAELGIDTASQTLAVAVLDGERVLAERRWRIETTASRELLEGIEAVLHEAGIDRDAIEAVAVDVGPGAYTGLRSGVATAQGLALGLGVPLAGVARLEADAFPHLAPGTPVVAVHNAGRSGLAWAAYVPCDAPEAGPPEALSAPRLDTPEDCARLAPAHAAWCGEITDELHQARADAGRTGDTDAAGGENGRSAADLVRLARLHRAYTDPAAVDVIYLRPPSIGARADRR
ncbi:MAG: tRNA (adenosine(37)-N6)-threonylcarbamoyltransferase complex dimerization subunit type 1 TsaB [Dehalococcoidia bacterium]